MGALLPIIRERVLFTQPTLLEIKDNFASEILKAKNNAVSSLSYIKHQMPKSIVAENEKFQVFVIGGTKFRTATYKKSGLNYERLSIFEGNFGFIGDRKELVEIIQASLDPEVTTIGINFAFPMTPIFRNGMLDGKLQRATKEHKLSNIISNNVGQSIEEDLYKLKGKLFRVSVANDSVCLWLAGRNEFESNLASGIVGTGMNIAIEDGGEIINLESADFDKFERSTTGKFVDDDSENPGHSFFEKEISGAYLYKHYNLLTRELEIDAPVIKSGEELSLIAKGEYNSADLANALLERSASLFAAQIAGVYKFKQLPTLKFIMEGSLFWMGTNYKIDVERYLTILGVPQNSITIIKVEDSDILGAVKLIA